MPIVATGPSCFTHSCEDAYFNPSTTAQSNSVLTLPPLHYKKKSPAKQVLKGQMQGIKREYQQRSILRGSRKERGELWRRQQRFSVHWPLKKPTTSVPCYLFFVCFGCACFGWQIRGCVYISVGGFILDEWWAARASSSDLLSSLSFVFVIEESAL